MLFKQSQQDRDKQLDGWEVDDPITASRLNDMTRKISESIGPVDTDPAAPLNLKFIELDEVIGPESSSMFVDRSGTVINYAENENTFKDFEEVDNIVDLFGLPYDRDERVVAVTHNGKYIPVSARHIRHAITCRDDDDEYPGRGEEPTVYPIKFVRLEFEETPGRQEYTVEYLQSDESAEGDPSDEGPEAFVYNLYDEWDQACEECLQMPYIPEGTIIWVYAAIGLDGQYQWFTYVCCSYDEESSSSSSSGGSSESSSSTSSSSVSSESGTSSSSSSTSTSSLSTSSSSTSDLSTESTSSTSDVSSTISSTTGSSTTASSTSVSEETSFFGDTVTVVSDVYCSSDDTEIIVCTIDLLFDAEGHFIGATPEECG